MKCQNLRLLDGRRVEVLGIDGGRDGVHVAAQDAARKSQAEEDALPARGIDGMVHCVVGQRRRERTGLDSVEGVGTVNTAEIDVLEVVGGRRSLRNDIRNIVSVSEAGAPEAAVQLIAGEDLKSVAVLHVIQQVL